MKILIIFTSALFFLQACSPIPYNNDFGCKREEAYGKCVTVEEAYEEAVTGVEKGKPLGKKAKKSKSETPKKESNSLAVYKDYRYEMLDSLRKLVAQPDTPIVKPPVQTRTLILSYIPRDNKRRLYQPRYVYSIAEDPEFVYGQYELQIDPSLHGIQQLLKGSE